LLIIVMILLSTASVFVYVQTGPPSASTAASSTRGESVPVGAVLYLWYGNETTGTGGLGSPGWNSTSCPGGGAVVDAPSAGYYVSDSNATFRRQVSEMQGAGISFAVVSWWGPSASGEAGAVNKATLDLFRFLEATDSSFKVAIMVDAFTTACGLPSLPMTSVEDYVQRTFVGPFGRWYFGWQGRPLLLFFNPLQPGSDANFTVRTIGNRPNAVDWTFWDASANFSEPQGGTGVNMSNDVGDPQISSDGEVTVVPRIDSYYNYLFHYQAGYLRFDPTLRLGLYRYEWNYVLSHRSDVKLVLIYSWNEYHERTEIEPAGATGAYLLNLTSRYANMLG
jgi:hypothetical protein